MAIKTSTFGGVTLSGDAAKAFKKQFIISSERNSAAKASLVEGRRMLKEYQKKGYVIIKSSKTDK